MTKRMNRILRMAAPLVSAVVLLQTTGCQVGSGELVRGLVGAILQSWVQQFVFGAFNLVP